MNFSGLLLCTVLGGAFTAGGLAVASPAWGTDDAARGCVLYAAAPEQHGSRVQGEGGRLGCSNTVTYFWVRVYRVIDHWPDAEIAVRGRQYMQDGDITADGSCDGSDDYYTHSSTATGLSGDTTESRRTELC